ncbi:MAG: isoprenylcysteine carboxylmethyltransferase family protein [Bacillota bacterium]|nr:isoprenylcysteine carboxylmethyltransferase family protein [Bacillota bacterium]
MEKIQALPDMKSGKAIKRTFWGASAFYALIAFEFLYMASPFAVYFYAVYRPALNFFNHSPLLAWLIRYFMPHFSQTSSAILNAHNIVGGILAVSGFLGFCIGACQVYYHKLAKKGAVTGGIYNFIRHPQYACFIICSFGLLILWPRFIVLIMFTTMLFVYYYLARAEERECEAKFGQSYIDYKNTTGMFLPIRIPKGRSQARRTKVQRAFMAAGIYIITIVAAVLIATGIENLTLNSLYTVYTKDSANISVCSIEKNKMENILNIALSNDEVKARLNEVGKGNKTRFLNYILPTTWYAAEIPMNSGGGFSAHSEASDYDRNLYKIIYTKVGMRKDNVSGKDILLNVVRIEPALEVWVNVSDRKVYKILGMPKNVMYKNTPVAIY